MLGGVCFFGGTFWIEDCDVVLVTRYAVFFLEAEIFRLVAFGC
jgi:hypothetical protein